MGYGGSYTHWQKCPLCGYITSSASHMRYSSTYHGKVCYRCDGEIAGLNHRMVSEAKTKEEIELREELILLDEELAEKERELGESRKKVSIRIDEILILKKKKIHKMEAVGISQNRQAILTFLNVGLFSFKPKELNEQNNH